MRARKGDFNFAGKEDLKINFDLRSNSVHKLRQSWKNKILLKY